MTLGELYQMYLRTFERLGVLGTPLDFITFCQTERVWHAMGYRPTAREAVAA